MEAEPKAQMNPVRKTFVVIVSESVQCEIQLDDQFTDEMLVMEAATRAIERMKPIDLPLTILVYADGRTGRAFIVYTHAVLANLGRYVESRKMQTAF